MINKRLLLIPLSLLSACVGGTDEMSDVPSDQAAAESALQGSNEAGQNLAGVNLAGVNLAGSNLAGSNLAGSNLAGSNLGAANLAATNLAGVNLGGTNLGAANLAGTNLAASNLAGTNLGGANLAGTNLAGTNLAGTNLGGANLAGSNLAGTNLAGSNLAGPSAGTAITGVAPSVTGTYRMNAAAFTAGTAGLDIHSSSPHTMSGLLMSGEDVLGNQSGRCIVLGVGSLAFSNLVEQNRTSGLSGANTMYAAIRQLPWGLANAANGAVDTNVWEMLVWGAKSYCVFLTVVPKGVTFEAVRGYVKAIFRWNAPPTASLIIGEVASTRATVTYPGMMGAAAHVVAGRISGFAHLSGLLAFGSATTNNISVQVDFASWVKQTDGGVLILGNVGNPGPTYIEGFFESLATSPGQVTLISGVSSKDAIANLNVSKVSDFNSTLLQATYDHLLGKTRNKPLPKRCLFMREASRNLWFSSNYSERYSPGTEGKCDDYLQNTLAGISTYLGDVTSGGDTFNCTAQLLGSNFVDSYSVLTAAKQPTVLPHNKLMFVDKSRGAYFNCTSPTTGAQLTPLAGKVTTLGATLRDTLTNDTTAYEVLSGTWTGVYEVPFTTCTPETDDAFCTRTQAPATCALQTANDNCASRRVAYCGCTGVDGTVTNVSLDSATTLAAGASWSGFMGSTSAAQSDGLSAAKWSVRYFKTTVPAGATRYFRLEAASQVNGYIMSCDGNWPVVNATGTGLWTGTNNTSAPFDIYTCVRGPVSATAGFTVRAFDPAAAPAVVAPLAPAASMLIMAPAGAPEVEPNNTAATAQVLSIGNTISGTFSSTTDTDYFSVTIAPGATATVRMTPNATSDYDLYAFNAAGTRVSYSGYGTGAVDQIVLSNSDPSVPLVISFQVAFFTGATGASGTYTISAN